MPDESQENRGKTPPKDESREAPAAAPSKKRESEPAHLPPGSLGDWAAI